MAADFQKQRREWYTMRVPDGKILAPCGHACFWQRHAGIPQCCRCLPQKILDDAMAHNTRPCFICGCDL